MKEYVDKLYHKLHEAMEKPVTLGSAEEVGMYAKTIRRLEKPVTLGSAEEVGMYAKTNRMRQSLIAKRRYSGQSICRMQTARPAHTGRWNRRRPLPRAWAFRRLWSRTGRGA